MNVPSRYVVSNNPKMCKLKKTVYGLKQSPRKFYGAMKKYSFKHSNSDHYLFLKHHEGQVTALIIYVEDIIVTKDHDQQKIPRPKNYLVVEFETKDIIGN